MKNIYKIFIALFLTLTIMPVMAGEYKIPDNEKPKVKEHQEIAEAQDANDIILAAVGLRQSSTTPSTGSTSSRVDNNASNGSTTSAQTQHVTTEIQPEPEPTTPNLTPTNGQPMVFSNPAEQVVTCKPGYKHNSDKTKCVKNNEETNKQNRTSSDIENSKASPTNPVDTRTAEERQKALDEKQAAYDTAKENEQSKENKMLTAATTAATGIGGMELAQGLAEKKADKDAEQNMTAYLATFRCKYGDAEPVKAGPDEIELPGGNDANMIKYRNEYFTLANDLKERKTALGMNPGIESQEILDKSQTGLYDDESVGIISGAYASLYRAQMLNSEQDQQQIDEEKKKSKNRVIAGAVVGGVGVVGGSLLGEKIKEKETDEAASKENQEVIDLLIKKLTKGGITNAKDLDFSRYNLSGLRDDISEIDPAKLSPFKGRNASQLINTSSRTTLANSLESLIYDNNLQQKFDKINQKNTRDDFFRDPSNNPAPTINFTPSNMFNRR